MYARLEEADPLVTSLTTDKDPVLRRSGMYTLAMAYCGTGSNKAIRKLLHIAVSKKNRIINIEMRFFSRSVDSVWMKFGGLTKNEFAFFFENLNDITFSSFFRRMYFYIQVAWKMLGYRFLFCWKLDHDSFWSCLKIEKLKTIHISNEAFHIIFNEKEEKKDKIICMPFEC